jgi:membrane protease YdiL (CAAX protease family)
LLFGLYRSWYGIGGRHARTPLGFGYYSILISMLSYTAWHLGKPLPEVWGTLVWGLATGTIALATGTIWPIIIVHWLLNIVLDVRLAWPHLPHP